MKVCIIFSTARRVEIIRSDAIEKARVFAAIADQPVHFSWRNGLAEFITDHVTTGMHVYVFEADMPDAADSEIKAIVEHDIDTLLTVVKLGELDDYGIKQLC